MTSATQYIIDWSDPSDKPSFVLLPGQENRSSSLRIFGMGAVAYGEAVTEDLLRLLENFSHTIPPTLPTKGQLWYRSTDGAMMVQSGIAGRDALVISTGENANTPVNTIKTTLASLWSPDPSPYASATTYPQLYLVSDSVGWVVNNGVYVSATPPTNPGSLWFDTTEQQLKVWNGVEWISVADNYIRRDGTGDPVTGLIQFDADAGLTSSTPMITNSILMESSTFFPAFSRAPLLTSVEGMHIVIDTDNNAIPGGARFEVGRGSAISYTDPNYLSLFRVNIDEITTFVPLNINGNDITNVDNINDINSITNIDLITKIWNISEINEIQEITEIGLIGDVTGITNIDTITTIGDIGEINDIYDLNSVVVTGYRNSPVSSNVLTPGGGKYGIVIDNRTHLPATDGGGIVIIADPVDGNQKAIEVWHPLSPAASTFSVWTKPQSDNLCLQTSGLMRSQATISDINLNGKNVTTKEYVDNALANFNGGIFLQDYLNDDEVTKAPTVNAVYDAIQQLWAAVNAVDIVPPGVVVAWGGGATNPSGWVECNGAGYDRTNPLYTPLFNAIGTIWGGVYPTFHVPDLRGEFIRGLDNGRGVDPGRSYGSAQTDSFKSHNHGLPETIRAGAIYSGYNMNGLVNSNLGYSVSVGADGGTETRPRNKAMRFIIKL